MSNDAAVSILRGGLAAAAMLMAAACGGPAGEEASAAAPAQPPSTEPRYGGSVVLGTPGEPVNFNGMYYQDTTSGDIVTLVFAGLVKVDEHIEVVPDIAEAMPEISADGTVYTVRLRRGVKFHDGVELTARDVVYTYDIPKHPDYTGPRADYFKALLRTEALDDYTVRFTLAEPDTRFITIMDREILPLHLLEHVPIGELGDYRAFNVDHPIGAGPFKFVSWTRGQNLVLEAFDDYFGGRPYLDRVTFRFAANQSAEVLLLETGDIDHMIVPITEVKTVEAMPHVKVYSTLELRYDYLGWNQRNPLFADRRVRQALTHAIDRQEIVDTLYEGRAQVANAPVSPLMAWAYTDDVAKFPYDPERAKALLKEAGWAPGPDGVLVKDGLRFSFGILSNDGNVVRRDIAVIVQQYLRQVGIEVRPAQMEWGAFLERINPPNYDFDATVLSWALATDPDPTAIWHSREIAQGLNNISFRNARIDEIADKNTRVLDRAERAAMLKEAWGILAEEQPYTFLLYPQQHVALSNKVHGFVHHSRLDMYSVPRWWVDP
jgi:peptide/nickel transport system substrate-binding protein